MSLYVETGVTTEALKHWGLPRDLHLETGDYVATAGDGLFAMARADFEASHLPLPDRLREASAALVVYAGDHSGENPVNLGPLPPDLWGELVAALGVTPG